MKNKLTRQGVRDLNSLKGKKVGKKMDMPPPEAIYCPTHKFKNDICTHCGAEQFNNNF